ncbi:MAG: hypothetical protein CME31_27215 [Gimesia sp.]|uniref:Uncharacterized protein n=2 Tax=Gimesia TaxID=1649453 RepID=A0A3D3R5M2_9PLAN|nr:hypothetical protein [Gimesia sp.]HCO23317.1 hypothetical protein [Gimesia maris]|tara:strand:- start:64002 stop:64514 length:513 start_codon:yes stop_codon:yes gene_type:complete
MRTFCGPIELSCGTYRDDLNISFKQQQLYGLVNEDQVIWCGQDEPALHTETGKYIHDIDADPRDIVAVIDSLVWCHILDYDSRYIPPEEHSDLRYQAGNSEGNYDEALRKAEDAYLADNLPKDLWTGVIKDDITKKSDQLLLKFPLVFSTIVNVDIVTSEMASLGRRKNH